MALKYDKNLIDLSGYFKNLCTAIIWEKVYFDS